MKKIRDNKGRAGRIMPLAVAVVVFILSFWGCVGAISVRAEEREEESDIEDVAEQNSVTQRQAGGTHVLTYYDTRYNDGLLRVGYFEIDGGTTAMCVCHEMEPPTQTGSTLTTVAEYTAENRGNEQLRKIYYYGWKGPGDVGASYVETCLAGSVANGHDDNYYGYGQAFINRIAGLPAAPKGFTVYLLSDGAAAHQNLGYWEYHPTGYARLKKTAEDNELTEDNRCYTLQGAEYGVYADESCTDQKAVLKTDANGETTAVELAPGNYYVKEKQAPFGYRLNSNVYPVTVEAEKTAVAEVKDTPVWNKAEVSICKVDAETGESQALGGADLAGAKMRVNYYAGYYETDNLPEVPERSWVLETKEEKGESDSAYVCRLDEAHLIEGDAFYMMNDQVILPLGTITVEEIEAPKGYLLDGMQFQDESGEVQEGRYLTQIRPDGDTAVLTGGNAHKASDHVIRGNLELIKIADGTHKRLSKVPFKITSNTTGESHVIVTDENGYASTSAEWNLHTSNTNCGENMEDGVWFGIDTEGTLTAPDDCKGALPYDTYTIEELRCEANQNHELIPPFEVTIKKDHVTVDLGTMTDDKPEVPEELNKPEKEKQETPGQTVKAQTVRTGDGANLSNWMLVCILSCVAVIVCVMITRMKKR